MAKETVAEPTTTTPVEPMAGVPAEPVTPVQEPEKDVEFWKGKAAAMEKDAKKAAKRLAELEEAETKRKEAELSEVEKLQKKLADTQKQYAEAERKAIRQKVAAEVGLPAVLAERLQGDDEEAMRADAAKLLEALPKATEPKKPTGPVINPTNPAAASLTETLAQKKERLHLVPGLDPFGDSFVQASGGGIFLTDKG
jgi:hypothetical protein